MLYLGRTWPVPSLRDLCRTCDSGWKLWFVSIYVEFFKQKTEGRVCQSVKQRFYNFNYFFSVKEYILPHRHSLEPDDSHQCFRTERRLCIDELLLIHSARRSIPVIVDDHKSALPKIHFDFVEKGILDRPGLSLCARRRCYSVVGIKKNYVNRRKCMY